jgi:Flp pilus assembly protein TadB
MSDDQQRMQLYEQELARLDVLYTELEGLWRHVPRYALLALLAPLVWYFASFGWAVVELLVTAALVATQAYLIGVRKNENRWNRELVARDLERLRRDLARG